MLQISCRGLSVLPGSGSEDGWRRRPPRAASPPEHSKNPKLKALNPETKAANIGFPLKHHRLG